MKVSAEILDELVKRLVAGVHPTRIILFGSASRGEMHEHSDLDVLVVVPDGMSQKEGWNLAFSSLRRFGFATDLVVVSEGNLAKYGNCPGLVYEQAIKEGRELYHAA
ncbi:MAG: nucleotidyltransferase domain-containing protein [Holophaga sp.]|nr:nucleotidyltransferase domain-containing protein [Holophaga sp.]